MIEVTIQYDCNATNLFLPCKDSAIQAAVEALQPPDTNDRKLMVTDIQGADALCVLKDRFVDLDELNYLAKRMDSFDECEMKRFIQAKNQLGAFEMKELINISFNLDRFVLITDISEPGKVGMEYELQTKGCVPVNAASDPEYAAAGKALLQSNRGIITEDGILFADLSRPLQEVYNGKQFPPYIHEPCLFVAELTCLGQKEYLYLPAEDISIERALARLGALSLEDCDIELDNFAGGHKGFVEACNRVLQEEGLYALNEAMEIVDFNVLMDDYECFTSAVAATGVTDSQGMKQIAENIGSFYLAKKVSNAADLGKWWLDNMSRENLPSNLEMFFDYSAYGEYLSADWEVFYMEDGNCVFLDSITNLRNILGGQDTGAMQMGGMV